MFVINKNVVSLHRTTQLNVKMKQSLLLFCTLCCLLFSCEKPEQTKPPLAINLNTPADLNVLVDGIHEINFAVKNTQLSTQTLSLTYDKTMVDIKFDGRDLPSGESYITNMTGENSLYFTALQAGATNVTIKVSEGGISSETQTRVTISNQPNISTGDYMLVKLEPNKILTVSRRYVIPFEIRKIDNTINKHEMYSMSARVIQGRGIVHIGPEMVWNDTLPSFESQTCSNLNYNQLCMYTGMSIGLHRVEYTIKDNKGSVSTNVVDYKIDSTAFNPTMSSIPAIIDLGRGVASVKFTIHETDNIITQYYVRMDGFNNPMGVRSSYHQDTVRGSDQLPLRVVNASSSNGIRTGSLDFDIVPLGGKGKTYSGTLIVGDSWGREYRFPLSTQLPSPKTTLSSTLRDPSPYSYSTHTNKMDLTLDNYSVDYTPSSYTVRFTPVTGCDDIQLYSHDLTHPVEWNTDLPYGFSLVNGNKRSLTANFLTRFGASDGDKEWLITVSDNFGGTNTYTQKVTIHPNILFFNCATTDLVFQSILIGREWGAWSLNSSLKSDDTDQLKNYAITATCDRKGEIKIIPIGTVVSGEENRITTATPLLQYHPREDGIHTINVTVKLDDGRTATKQFQVSALYPVATAELANSKAQIKEGEAHNVTAILQQPGFSGKFKYKVRFIQGDGELYQSGARILENIYFESPSNAIDNRTQFNIDYECAGYNGPVELEITAQGFTDKTTAITTCMPFTVQATTPSIKATVASKQVNTKSVDITLDLQKVNYSGSKLKVTYNVANSSTYVGQGTFNIVGGKEYSNGQYIYKYTAEKYGNTKINFTVTDEYGHSSTGTIDFVVSPVNYKVNLPYGNAEAEIYTMPGVPKGEERSFTFKVSEDGGYNGNFDLDWEQIAITGPGSDGLLTGMILLDGKELVDNPIKISTGLHTMTVRHIGIDTYPIEVHGQITLTLSRNGAYKTFIVSVLTI